MIAAASPAERPGPNMLAAGTVRCAGERQFRMQAGKARAVIWVGRQTLVLQRNPSASMTRYSAPNAALAIEGDFVAFVMDDALDFEECHLSRDRLESASTGM